MPRSWAALLCTIGTLLSVTLLASCVGQTVLLASQPTPPPVALPLIQNQGAPTLTPQQSATPIGQPSTTPIGQPSDTPTPSGGPNFYVATNGTPNGNGSMARPWDLETALSQPSTVLPGAVIWLRGGTYRGTFVSSLQGISGKPITVRQFAGERAVIDGRGENATTLAVSGAWGVYWGFEITNSDPDRIADDVAYQRPLGVEVYGPNNTFINMVVHDTGTGFGVWKEAVDSEIYGAIIYNCGWENPERGNGHAIYAQNETGTKRIVDNIMFNQFSHGIHVYGSDQAFLRGFVIEGNIAFNNGGPSMRAAAPNILVGGESPAERIQVRNNATYAPLGISTNARFDYEETYNKDIVVSGNYFAGGEPVVRFKKWRQATFTDNTLVADAQLMWFPPPSDIDTSAYQWNQNRYFFAGSGGAFSYREQTLEYEEWRSATGFDTASQYSAAFPQTPTVIVRPNHYEAGRAHIAVYNYGQAATVAVDVASVLEPGDTYQLRNAQDFFGPPVLSGTYDGNPLQVPLASTALAAPIGGAVGVLQSTAPIFNAFVLIR